MDGKAFQTVVPKTLLDSQKCLQIFDIRQSRSNRTIVFCLSGL